MDINGACGAQTPEPEEHAAEMLAWASPRRKLIPRIGFPRPTMSSPTHVEPALIADHIPQLLEELLGGHEVEAQRARLSEVLHKTQ